MSEEPTAKVREQTWNELREHERLPSPSPVAQRVWQFAGREEVDASALARAMEPDPALTGTVIRIANSPALRGRRPVTSVADAVVRIGLNALRQVALAVSVLERYRHGAPDGIARNFDIDRFWAESLGTAVGAEAAAGQVRAVAPEEAFALGLLARIGMLAYAVVYPDTYEGLIERAPDPAVRRHEEQTTFGLDHMELSVRLLKHWGVAPVLAERIPAWYGIPAAHTGELRERRLEHIVHIGARVAHALAPEGTLSDIEALCLALGAAGIAEEDHPPLIVQARERWQELAPLCGLSPDVNQWAAELAGESLPAS